MTYGACLAASGLKALGCTCRLAFGLPEWRCSPHVSGNLPAAHAFHDAGIIYGLQPWGLAQQLGVSVGAAQVRSYINCGRAGVPLFTCASRH